MSKSTRGDTIIEVMIATALIGIVLSVCYVSVNRSLKVGVSANERSEATRYVESVIEQVRDSARLTSSPVFTKAVDQTFCIKFNPDTQTYVLTDVLTPDTITSIPLECSKGVENRYKIYLSRHDNGDVMTFHVRAKWESVKANQTDSIDMYYRLHKGQI